MISIKLCKKTISKVCLIMKVPYTVKDTLKKNYE